MAKLQIVAGTTSKLLDVFIQDSSSTTGAGLTGLVFNTGSLTAYYYREGAASATAITLATMTLGTWATGGFIVVDGTNMPGCYQIGIPNAAIAASAKSCLVMLKGAANMAPIVLEIELTATDNQDAVHGGMSALPNTACTTNASLLTSGTGTDQLSVASGRIDAGKLLGTAIATPATAGVLDVNVKNMNNVAATSITTINANQGTTQPHNFTGTGASALVKSDMVDVAGAAVSTSTAQIGVNAVNHGGTAQTGRDIGLSVLISSGSGTGQLDVTSGVIKANLVQILATALTETAGLLAGGFKQFFNVATPTGTLNSLPNAVPDAAGGLPVTGNRLTAIPTVAAVTTVTTTTNLTNAPTSGDLTSTMKTSVQTAAAAALITDTYAEPGQATPAATASLKDKIGYLYKLMRNKVTNDGTTINVYNSGGSTVDQKSTVSETAGTVTRGEFATGP